MKRAKKDLLKKIHGAQIAQLLSTACRLDLFDLIGEKGATLSFLADKTRVEPKLLERFLLSLVALELLEERQGLFRLSEQGDYLRQGGEDSLYDIARLKGAPFLWQAQGTLFEGLKANLSPFELVHGLDLFSYLESHPEESALFHKAMRSYEEKSSKKILESIDFTPFALIADIGGGFGGFLSSVLERASHARGILFERPSVIEKAKEWIEEPFLSRMKLEEGSFFDSVPRADLYLLRNIIHDWSDVKALEILATIRASASTHSQLFLFETLVEKNGEKPLGKFSDMTLFMMTSGGFERTKEEIVSLIQEAGFHIEGVEKPGGSKSLIRLSLPK